MSDIRQIGSNHDSAVKLMFVDNEYFTGSEATYLIDEHDVENLMNIHEDTQVYERPDASLNNINVLSNVIEESAVIQDSTLISNVIEESSVIQDSTLISNVIEESSVIQDSTLISNVIEESAVQLLSESSELIDSSITEEFNLLEAKHQKINKRKDAKEKQMKGEKYLGFRRAKTGETNIIFQDTMRDERQLKPRGCSVICNRAKTRMCNSISEEQHEEIFNTFGKKMNWEAKKTMICTLIIREPVKQRKTLNEHSRQNCSLYYNLKIADKIFPVCKNMFNNTFGISESETRYWIEAYHQNNIPNKKSPQASSSDMPKISPRVNVSKMSKGQSKKAKKRKLEIENFLNSLPKLPSHYCHKSSKKFYLQLDIKSKEQLYIIYKKYCSSISPTDGFMSKTHFKHKCKAKQITIFKSRKDQCDVCYKYFSKNLTDEQFSRHQYLKNLARTEKLMDKTEATTNNTFHLICMDLMAVQNIPQLKASAAYYKLKLCLHNFTMYDLVTKDATAYWFDETAATLSASTFASCVVSYISELLDKELKSVIIYSDGCTSQNRNAVMANALLHLSMSRNITITQKYLEKGHTQMECDSIHSLIERKCKNIDIFLPSQFMQITQEARYDPFQYKSILLDHSFFVDYTKNMIYSKICPGRKAGNAVVVDMKIIKYNPTGTIEYKLSYEKEEEYKNSPWRPNHSKISHHFPPLFKEPMKIPKDKWTDLQDLKLFMPADCHNFYDVLPCQDSSQRKQKTAGKNLSKCSTEPSQPKEKKKKHK